MIMKFARFSFSDHADKFKEYLSFKHIDINFFIEKEKDGCLPFLDGNIFCENKKVATKVHRKTSFSGNYTNLYQSFISESYKIGLIKDTLKAYFC